MALADVIKYEGDNSTFVWKHPSEDFNTNSQLIVHEAQEALFFLNGEALDLFGPGRHTLETQNIPFISRVLRLPTGGENPFHCKVYFFNTAEHMAIKWGTDSKVQFLDPEFQFPLEIGASGEMAVKVSDARRLLVKVIGTESDLSREKLITYFRALLMTELKTSLVKTIRNQEISIFEIDGHLSEFSVALQGSLNGHLQSYGLDLTQFFVTTIVKPDGDSIYEEFKQLHFRRYADPADAQIRQETGVIDEKTRAQQKLIDAESEAEKRRIEGYTYADERQLDVAEKMAENEAVGQFTNMGVGMGMIAGVAGPVGGAVSNMVGDAMTAGNQQANPAATSSQSQSQSQSHSQGEGSGQFCGQCGTAYAADANFCMNCGSPHARAHACAQCGGEIPNGANFCPACGQSRQETS